MTPISILQILSAQNIKCTITKSNSKGFVKLIKKKKKNCLKLFLNDSLKEPDHKSNLFCSTVFLILHTFTHTFGLFSLSKYHGIII